MKINYDNRIFGLDIMRAAAILMVVFSHTLWILLPRTKNLVTEVLSLSGLLGVEIFFVLSGFLIGRIIYNTFVNGDFTIKKVGYFWIRRWFRTLPNYYLILIVNIGLVIYFKASLPENIVSYFFFLQNFSTEMPGFFVESWSLPIEEFAYIIGPLLLYLIMFLRLPLKRKYLFGIITLLIIVCFMVNKVFYNINNEVKDMNYWNVNLKAVTIYRIDAVYYGVLAAWVSILIPKIWKKYRYFLFLLGLFILASLNFVIPSQKIFIENHSFFWDVLYLPINSLVFVMCLPLLSSINSAPKLLLIPITYISIISYSMYLLHYSVVMQLLQYYFTTEGLVGIQLYAYLFVYLMLTFISSYLLYRFFEKPFMDLRDKSFFLKRFKAN
ncbi:acyltransferase [Winogradskyella sp.]|nr:acyltransferase [Winogradskyella sp.]MDB4752293.1 acyltransferase [Winogradskyella sp.]